MIKSISLLAMVTVIGGRLSIESIWFSTVALKTYTTNSRIKNKLMVTWNKVI
jgi:hypothetical protein